MRFLGRLVGIAVLIAGCALAAVDLRQPPAKQRLARLALQGVSLYQATLSRWMLTAGFECRFDPTCSRYAAAVIEQEGVWPGAGRVLARIVRCGPWTPAGTVDPP